MAKQEASRYSLLLLFGLCIERRMWRHDVPRLSISVHSHHLPPPHNSRVQALWIYTCHQCSCEHSSYLFFMFANSLIGWHRYLQRSPNKQNQPTSPPENPAQHIQLQKYVHCCRKAKFYKKVKKTQKHPDPLPIFDNESIQSQDFLSSTVICWYLPSKIYWDMKQI